MASVDFLSFNFIDFYSQDSIGHFVPFIKEKMLQGFEQWQSD